MQIKVFQPEHENEWDNFVSNSSNGLFQFYRKYMTYHSDRFQDFSLMFYDADNRLIAILPANIENDIVYSHKGLSFGGIVHQQADLGTAQQIELFQALFDYLANQGIQKFVYKPIPMLYHLHPVQTDLYILNQQENKSIDTLLSTTIDLDNPGALKYRRKRCINKAVKHNLQFQEDSRWEDVWTILSERLQDKHNALPTHTIQEILFLHQSFPQNIKLYTVTLDQKVLAGIVTYETPQVIHTQYICVNEEGSQLGALDFLIISLIEKFKQHVRYFDFGISTEDRGKKINFGLIKQKEEFGGSSTIHQIYTINLNT